MKRPVRTAVEGLSVGTTHLEAAARVPKCAGSVSKTNSKLLAQRCSSSGNFYDVCITGTESHISPPIDGADKWWARCAKLCMQGEDLLRILCDKNLTIFQTCQYFLSRPPNTHFTRQHCPWKERICLPSREPFSILQEDARGRTIPWPNRKYTRYCCCRLGLEKAVLLLLTLENCCKSIRWVNPKLKLVFARTVVLLLMNPKCHSRDFAIYGRRVPSLLGDTVQEK